MRRIWHLVFLAMASACAGAPIEDAASQTASGAPPLLSASGALITRDDIEAFVDGQMESLDMPGLSIAVIYDGEIVYRASKGVADTRTGEPVDEGSIFEAASLSKPVFAYFTLRLVDQGVLDLDRPLHLYLPMEELEHDTRYHRITARMALSHQTGFPNWRWFDPAPEEMNIPRGEMYMKGEPGEFGYSGEGYNYLALVIAYLTGRDMTTLDDLFQQEVARPLGMTCSAFIRTECVAANKVTGHRDSEPSDEDWPRSFPDDTPMTFGSAGRLHTEAVDYARFMLALLDGSGLPPALLDQMFTAQVEIPEDSETRALTGETAWGLGLAIEPTPYGVRYEHGGNNGEFQAGMTVFRETGLGYVFMTNSDRGEEFNTRLERFITLGPAAQSE